MVERRDGIFSFGEQGTCRAVYPWLRLRNWRRLLLTNKQALLNV